ncbi:MAG: phosphoribosylamine--glycine ligase [Bacteroidetes bacterium]|nr:phosphoribosylamine--glycine ligase [Bacteroidota bacterium]MBU1719087.1 phosphoribosylamine--glycine ligase [Bacteroidota bacterium]
MNVLILGSGGRENALAWKIAQSNKLSALYIAPGNAGSNRFGLNVDMNPLDFASVRDFVLEKKIDILIPGPEDPLVKGIADFFKNDPAASHVAVIGPSAKAAQLEGSKDFAKAFMTRHKIPTAKYQTFTSEKLHDAYDFLESLQQPYVLKADGLAAGKGVLITPFLEEAKDQLRDMLSGELFGVAGSKVVIEEFLSGIELSVFVLSDGENFVFLPEAKDYKRIGEGDTGPNTGGMGAVSPVPFATADFLNKVQDRIVIPTLKGMKADGNPFVGFLFVGLMNVGGDPCVIEYNVRLGDPETEAILPRISSDLLDLFIAVKDGKLDEAGIEISPETATTVILVSGGYPGSYNKGKRILIGDTHRDSLVFHAGTILDEGKLLTNGGRVIAVTSLAANLEESLAKSFKSAEAISFDGMYYRSDIGKDLML